MQTENFPLCLWFEQDYQMQINENREHTVGDLGRLIDVSA